MVQPSFCMFFHVNQLCLSLLLIRISRADLPISHYINTLRTSPHPRHWNSKFSSPKPLRPFELNKKHLMWNVRSTNFLKSYSVKGDVSKSKQEGKPFWSMWTITHEMNWSCCEATNIKHWHADFFTRYIKQQIVALSCYFIWCCFKPGVGKVFHL